MPRPSVLLGLALLILAGCSQDSDMISYKECLGMMESTARVTAYLMKYDNASSHSPFSGHTLNEQAYP